VTSPIAVITTPPSRVPDEELARRERDTLPLTAEERRGGRRRVQTRSGRELALALPAGIVLAPGDVLYVARDWYVVVEAAPEPVLAIRPRSREEALHVAYEVGSRHFALSVDGDALLVPDDGIMEQLLGRLGVPWERTHAGFVPLRSAHRTDR
jgi:urease accessory protein